MQTNNGKRASILIVEDTVSQAKRLKTTLEDSHTCDVLVAYTGEDGLAAAQQRKFDLIILDVELPGISGFDVCRQLKEAETLADIPVIMLTTRDQAQDALTGLANGAIDYIPKDAFADMVLLETIRQMAL